MAGALEGNTNAKKGRDFRQALRKALARDSGTASQGLEKVATKLVEAAIAGEPWAIKEIADRTDGKPAQAIVGDNEHDPVSVVQRIMLGELSDDGDSSPTA